MVLKRVYQHSHKENKALWVESKRDQNAVFLIKVMQDWVWWAQHTTTVLEWLDPLSEVVENITWNNEGKAWWLSNKCSVNKNYNCYCSLTYILFFFTYILYNIMMMIIASHLLKIIYVASTILSTLCKLAYSMLTIVLSAFVFPFYRWICWGPESSIYLPKVTLPVILYWNRDFSSRTHSFNHPAPSEVVTQPQSQWITIWTTETEEAG